MPRGAKQNKFGEVSTSERLPLKPSTNQPRYYVPFTARAPWLIAILILVLACIAVLELAFRQGIKLDLDDKNNSRRIKRQEASSTTSTLLSMATTDGYITISTADAPAAAAAGDGSSRTSSTIHGILPSHSYVTISTSLKSTVSTNTASTASSFASLAAPGTSATGGYILLETTTASPTPSSDSLTSPETTYYDTASDAYILPATSTSASGGYITLETSVAATGGYITLETNSKKQNDQSTINAEGVAIPATSSDAVAVVTSITGAYVLVTTTFTSNGQTYTSTGTTSMREVGSAAPNSYNTITTTANDMETTSYASGKTVANIFGGATPGTMTTSMVAIITTQTLNDGSVMTSTILVASASTSPTAPPPPDTLSGSMIQIGAKFTEFDYFSASYLAVIVAVVLKSLWEMSFASMKMMEPFYQLSRPEGATAKESLLSDYLTTGYSISNIVSMFTGNWIMLLTTGIYVCFIVLAPLATESMTVAATAYCKNSTGGSQPCNAVWILDTHVARGLQGVLNLIALLIVVLIAVCWRRRSRVFSNPSSIASMAALLSHEDVLIELRRIDPSASNTQIAAALSGNNYKLGSYETAPGVYRYGLTKTISSMSPYQPTHTYGASSRYSQLSNPSNLSLTSHPPSHTHSTNFSFRALRDTLFLFSLLGLLGVILAYYLDSADDQFNRFFNSGSFGPRLILTAAAVLIDCHWKTLEREVRIMTPYRRLGKRLAKPEHSILVSVNGTPFSSLPLALWRGEFFHAFIAGTAILADFLIVAVGGVPFSHAQIWQAFLASTYISMGILGTMVLGVFAMFWWRMGNERLRMPREPDNLVGVWLGVCGEGNGVRREFEGWEAVEGGVRDEACRMRRGRYWGGWVREKEEDSGGGGWRWCVEREVDGQVVGY